LYHSFTVSRSHHTPIHRITLYTVTEPHKLGGRGLLDLAYKGPFSRHLRKFIRSIFCFVSSPGLCTICIMIASSSVQVHIVGSSLFYSIRTIRSLMFLVLCLGLDLICTLHQKGIRFIAPFTLVVWPLFRPHILAFLGVLFDTIPIPLAPPVVACRAISVSVFFTIDTKLVFSVL